MTSRFCKSRCSPANQRFRAQKLRLDQDSPSGHTVRSAEVKRWPARAATRLRPKKTRPYALRAYIPSPSSDERNSLKSLVGAARFELATPCAQGRCATRLRYAPISLVLLILIYRVFCILHSAASDRKSTRLNSSHVKISYA